MANEASGSFVAPPPGAPQEVSQDLHPSLIAEQLAKAHANERALPPLTFSPGVSPTPVLPTAPPTNPPVAPPAVVVAPSAPPSIVLTDPPQTLAEAAARDEARSYQPAASNSDSPSRGIPRPIADPGKVITGGFGHAMEAQYFPLDGSELRVLVLRLLDNLRDQVGSDLHFTPAMCYPRVDVRLRLEVTGFTADEGFTIQKGVLHDKTPEAVAAAVGQPVAFGLEERRAEFDPETQEPVDPPDRIRDDLGLMKPHKQQIETGTGKMIVDVPTIIDGSF